MPSLFLKDKRFNLLHLIFLISDKIIYIFGVVVLSLFFLYALDISTDSSNRFLVVVEALPKKQEVGSFLHGETHSKKQFIRRSINMVAELKNGSKISATMPDKYNSLFGSVSSVCSGRGDNTTICFPTYSEFQAAMYLSGKRRILDLITILLDRPVL